MLTNDRNTEQVVSRAAPCCAGRHITQPAKLSSGGAYIIHMPPLYHLTPSYTSFLVMTVCAWRWRTLHIIKFMLFVLRRQTSDRLSRNCMHGSKLQSWSCRKMDASGNLVLAVLYVLLISSRLMWFFLLMMTEIFIIKAIIRLGGGDFVWVPHPPL